MNEPKHADLFAPVIVPARMHPQFRELIGSPCHADARALMNQLLARMGDPNGNFIRDFQSDGFHSRLFELASFAYLESAGLAIDRSYERPDFLASGGGMAIAVECVTANPPSGQATDISLREMIPLSDAAIFAKVSREFPKRIAKILRRKLAYAYHDLPQCQGKPLVLMVAPFFEAGSVFYTDDALFYPLLGAPDPEAEIVPPFFLRPDSKTVSAILYCNQFTVPRFLRLSTNFTDPVAPHVIRHGTCYLAHKDGDFTLRDFSYVVGSEGTPKETWHEGVTIFENPNALSPLPRDFLPASSHVSVREACVYREVRGFHPVVSFTQIHIKPEA
jgi:hypothetical protein